MEDVFAQLEKSLPRLIFEAPPGKLLDVLRCLRVVINNDDFFFQVVPPLCLEYHLQHCSIFSFPLTPTIQLQLGKKIKTESTSMINATHCDPNNPHGDHPNSDVPPVVSFLVSRENHLLSYASGMALNQKQHGGAKAEKYPVPSEGSDKNIKTEKASSTDEQNENEEEEINVWDEIQEENALLAALEEYLHELPSVEVLPIENVNEAKNKSLSKEFLLTKKMTEEEEEEEDLFASFVDNAAVNVGLESIHAVFFDTHSGLYIEVDPVRCCCLRVFPFLSDSMKSYRIENKQAASAILSIEDFHQIKNLSSHARENPSSPSLIERIIFPSSHILVVLEEALSEITSHHYQKVTKMCEKYKQERVGVALPPLSRWTPSSLPLDSSVPPSPSENLKENMRNNMNHANKTCSIQPSLNAMDIEVQASFQLVPLLLGSDQGRRGFPFSLANECSDGICDDDQEMIKGVKVVYGIFWISQKEGLRIRWKTSLSIMCQCAALPSSQPTLSGSPPVRLTIKGVTSTRFFLGEPRTTSAVHVRSETPLSFFALIDTQAAHPGGLPSSSSRREGNFENNERQMKNLSDDVGFEDNHQILENEMVESIKAHLAMAGEQMKHALFSVSTKKGWEIFRCPFGHPLIPFFSHS